MKKILLAAGVVLALAGPAKAQDVPLEEKKATIELGSRLLKCGVVWVNSTKGSHAVALYFSGARHAGENLDRLLALRPTEKGRPIQMCVLYKIEERGGCSRGEP